MKHRPTLEQTYFVDYYMFCTNLSHREKQQIIYCYYLQEGHILQVIKSTVVM